MSFMDDSIDKNNCRPMHIAAEGGYTNIVKLLIEYKADVHPMDTYKRGHSQTTHDATMINHI